MTTSVVPEAQAAPGGPAVAPHEARVPRWFSRYASFLFRRPRTAMAMILAVLLLVSAIALPLYDVQNEPPRGRAAYAVENDVRTERLDAYIKARDSVVLGDAAAAQARGEAQGVDDSVQLVFEAPGSGSVFTQARLEAIKRVHDDIVGDREWEDYCWRCPPDNATAAAVPGCGAGEVCRPPKSPVNYFWPSEGADGPVYDGRGADMADIDETLALLAASMDPFAANSTAFCLGAEFEADHLRSGVTRIILDFGMPRPGYLNEFDETADQSDEIGEYQLRLAERYLDDRREDDMDGDLWLGFYSQTAIFAREVDRTLAHDSLLAVGSMVFVYCFMAYHTQSTLVAALGMTHILFSFPCAIFISRVMLGIRYQDTMSALLIYVLLAIGADDCFILIDHWRQARAHAEPSAQLLASVLWKAGGAMLVTSCTTAVAFFAQAISPLMPSAAFGTFATGLILSNFLLVVTWFPAVLVFWDRHVRAQRGCCGGCDRCAGLCDKPKGEDERKHQPRRVERFFEHFWGPLVRRHAGKMLLCMAGVVALFVAYAVQIKEATRAPDFFPDEHMMTRLQHALADDFKSSTDDPAVEAVLVWGVEPGVDRSGFSKFDFGSDRCDGGPCGRVRWDASFDPSDPDAQEYMLEQCERAAQVSCVRSDGEYKLCWIASLRYFRLARGESFPVPADEWDDALAAFYADATVDTVWGSSKLSRYDDGRLYYATAVVELNYRPSQFYTATEIEPCYDAFVDFMRANNANGDAGMFVTTNPRHAFFTRGKMIEEFALSARRGVGVAIALAFAVILVSLRSLYVSLIVIVDVVAVVATTLGVFSMLGWELGVIESICVSIVTGFSIDPVAHYAISYMESPAARREDRMQQAFTEIGVSVMGGAATTAGASMLLLATWFRVFLQFGIFMIVTVTCSMLYACVLFAGMMMRVGPDRVPSSGGETCRKGRVMRALGCVWSSRGATVGVGGSSNT